MLLPYIQDQKLRKFDHKVNGLLPGVGALQTVADALHAAEKSTDDSLHAIRYQRGKELMAACKRGCPMAKNIGAELLGSLNDISAQTALEAYMKDTQGWRYLADKMQPKVAEPGPEKFRGKVSRTGKVTTIGNAAHLQKARIFGEEVRRRVLFWRSCA